MERSVIKSVALGLGGSDFYTMRSVFQVCMRMERSNARQNRHSVSYTLPKFPGP